MSSNSHETRQCEGYLYKWNEAGRTRIEVKCPFCARRVTAYLWSLAGSGKKCSCGAKMDSGGTFTKDMTK